MVARNAGEVEPALPGTPEPYPWRGFEVAYTEAGDREDPDLLLGHGVAAAASSREFAEVLDALSREYHVVAPDLPGFGRSERPPILYSASLYETFLADAMADLVENPVVVASSLSGAYAASAASDVAVDSLVLITPTDETMGAQPGLWVRQLFRTPLVGTALFNLVVSKRGMRYFHADYVYANLENLSEATLDYEWRSAHQPGAKYAPDVLSRRLPGSERELIETLSDLEVPVTLIWGREVDTTPVETAKELAEATNCRLIVFDDSKLLPHVEHPSQFVDVVTGRFDEERTLAKASK